MLLDLLIKNVYVYNSYYKEFIVEDVIIKDGRFLYMGKEWDTGLEFQEVIDGQGYYMIPGLIDIHLHIESSMTTPSQFSAAIIRHGTTTVVADPHEIANVLGIEGIKAMIDSYNGDGVDIFYGIPSSVPSTSQALETTGGRIGLAEVLDLLKLKQVCCLGEVMNCKDLVAVGPTLIKQIIGLVKKQEQHLPIEGHCPKISGYELANYIYNGVDSDHTQQTPETIAEKIKNGMFMEIQSKSLTQDNITYLVKHNLFEHFCFVTDDVMADKLMAGHLNLLIKDAIKLGMAAEDAIYAATYTPALRMGMKDRGSIAPGKIADFILLQDKNKFMIDAVYKNGKKVETSDNGAGCYFPRHFYRSVKLSPVSQQDFMLNVPMETGRVRCRVMYVTPDTTFTQAGEGALNIINNELQWEDSAYCLICVFERYTGSGRKGVGLVGGSIIKEGAIATTYAHDHHNLLVMGRNKRDMEVAANWVIANQGGYCVVKNGQVIAALELPIGGILSAENVQVIGSKLKKIRVAMQAMGYQHQKEIMSFSTLSLPVSPSLKITDQGLIDVRKQEIVQLIID
ncbi:MAG: adenine deaminase C-terminal domain-containing protein [bacterium]